MNDPLASILERLQREGGLREGAARKVSLETGVPEAQVYGTGSFYHLLARPQASLRVCTGLSCLLKGAAEVLSEAQNAGLPVEACSCLAACDRAPAVLSQRRVLPDISSQHIRETQGDWRKLSQNLGESPWMGCFGPKRDDAQHLAINLGGSPVWQGSAFAKARQMGPLQTIEALKKADLRGRGGAGFPAHIKWSAVRNQAETTRYVVLNADEGEPGTFKDREILLRRPDLVLEGLAIAANAVGAGDVYLYLRGEFQDPWQVIEAAIERVTQKNLFPDISFHMHAGHGAYICGEETALIEALEGKRGMPRLRPPFPVEKGLWQKPTLVHNVETIACIPAIVNSGGAWFAGLGKVGPGTKLYCISGHVTNPGTYELPYGICLDELVAEAGGYVGNLKAFSPGGASAGFLPASLRQIPLTFEDLAKTGSMLGSAGVVVLNETVDIKWAVLQQMRFFEAESCGQCAPCRIGTRFLRESVERICAQPDDEQTLGQIAEAAWQMNEGSICGLGQAAPLPLTLALKYFPEDFQ